MSRLRTAKNTGICVKLFRILILYFVVSGSVSVASDDNHELIIRTSDGRKLDFTIELATTPEQRRQGLMFRQNLAPRHGMLFDYHSDRQVSFWMKNTYIPLDILFISSGGKIIRIHRNAEPHSTSMIASGSAVRAVLEINAGETERLGIREGNTVQFSIFK